MRDGILTRVEGEERRNLADAAREPSRLLCGDPRCAQRQRENPVPASQAIQIMELIELGIESARHRAALCLF